MNDVGGEGGGRGVGGEGGGGKEGSPDTKHGATGSACGGVDKGRCRGKTKEGCVSREYFGSEGKYRMGK